MEVLEESFFVEGEVNDVATSLTDSVVVRLSLNLVARFGFTEVELLDKSSGNERLEGAVDGDEVDVGEGSVNVLRGERGGFLFEDREDLLAVLGESHRSPIVADELCFANDLQFTAFRVYCKRFALIQ